MREHIYLFCLVVFKGQNQRGVCQRERVKGDCKVREVKRSGWREMGLKGRKFWLILWGFDEELIVIRLMLR